MRWLVSAALFLTPLIGIANGAWHTFTDTLGRKIEAKVLNVEGEYAIVELKSNGKQLPLSFDRLCEEDVEFLNHYEAPEDAAGNASPGKAPDNQTLPGGGPEPSRLYPRTREEIRSGIREINGRKKPAGISRDVFEATKLLNIYRFLCGVPSDVEPDAGFSARAGEAAIACMEHGGLSHDLGHSTNRCNLSSSGNMPASVAQYIEDGGANNRDARGHRAWCLNPPMQRVGFGSAGDRYSAMWCMDASGSSHDGIWTYPGRGLFPLDYMHGNAWSLYGAGRPDAPDKMKIEMYRLSKRPDRPFSATEEIPGHEIRINHVSLAMKGINFEPEEPAKRGVYWVRVNGGGIQAGYLVELY